MSFYNCSISVNSNVLSLSCFQLPLCTFQVNTSLRPTWGTGFATTRTATGNPARSPNPERPRTPRRTDATTATARTRTTGTGRMQAHPGPWNEGSNIPWHFATTETQEVKIRSHVLTSCLSSEFLTILQIDKQILFSQFEMLFNVFDKNYSRKTIKTK